MKKINLIIFIVYLILTIISCNDNPSGPPPPTENNILEENAFHQIDIIQTDYQKIEILNNSNFNLNSERVSSIILGNKNIEEFYAIDTTSITYEQVDGDYKLNFHFNKEIDDTTLIYKFTLRYVFTDGSTYDFDTSKIMYKYPYQSTVMFLRMNDFVYEFPPNSFQDFDIVDSILYYHPYGPEGLHAYNLNTKDNSMKIDYSSGDYIAANKNFVFCDYGHWTVIRYNLSLDSVDSYVDIYHYVGDNIKGMEVYNNELYVLTDKSTIQVYNMDLQHQRNIIYPKHTYGLTISNSIAYSNFDSSDTKEIIRFNLETNNFLEPVPYPTADCDAIRIIGEKMYFTDYTKKILCYLDVSDLNNQ